MSEKSDNSYGEGIMYEDKTIPTLPSDYGVDYVALLPTVPLPSSMNIMLMVT